MDKAQLITWISENKSISDIEKLSGKGFSTVRYWLKKFDLKTNFVSCGEKDARKHNSILKPVAYPIVDESHLEYFKWNESQQGDFSYLLGFYLGDGHLINPKGRSFGVIFTNETTFLEMNQRLQDALKTVFPSKDIKIRQRKTCNCVDIAMYGVNLDLLFPHGKGYKHTRKIELTDWQLDIIDRFPKPFLKGMIESDGCRYISTKNIMYQFNNCSMDLHEVFQRAAKQLDLPFTFHTSKSKEARVTPLYKTCFYRKKVTAFLDTFIGPKK